jgi:hypothetical protein
MKNITIAVILLAVLGTTLFLNCYAGKSAMKRGEHLYILWTNSDPVTADKMVFMYARNGLKNGWWKEITIVIWGSTAKLAGENGDIQNKLKELIAAGVHVSACKACADELGVTEALVGLGIDVKYWGTPLTEIIKSHKPLLTI